MTALKRTGWNFPADNQACQFAVEPKRIRSPLACVNIRPLELFYQVAKHEGITAAIHKMPCGIQQPAVNGQLLRLGRHLGVKLFSRRPFSLPPALDIIEEYAASVSGSRWPSRAGNPRRACGW